MNYNTMTTRVFVQSGDDQQADELGQQHLKIESLDSGAGTFVILSTERFAFESNEEINALARELKAALKVNVLPNHNDHQPIQRRTERMTAPQQTLELADDVAGQSFAPVTGSAVRSTTYKQS